MSGRTKVVGEQDSITCYITYYQGFLGSAEVKNAPANAGDARRTGLILDWEDSLEVKMATRSSLLAWEIPWTEGSGELRSIRLQKAGHD